jgi:hypothetical protein
MKKLYQNTALIKNPNTDKFEGLPALAGESAYQIAVRLGTFSGTEEEWNNYIKTERDNAIKAIENKGNTTLASIPEEYTDLQNDVDIFSDNLNQFKKGNNVLTPLFIYHGEKEIVFGSKGFIQSSWFSRIAVYKLELGKQYTLYGDENAGNIINTDNAEYRRLYCGFSNDSGISLDNELYDIAWNEKTASEIEVEISSNQYKYLFVSYYAASTDDNTLGKISLYNKQGYYATDEELNSVEKSLSFIQIQTLSSKWITELIGDYRMQGFCKDTINNRYFFTCPSKTKNGDTKICVASDIEFFKDMDHFIVQAGHGNDCTYNPDNGKLYVTTGYNPEAGQEGDIAGNQIAEIDIDTKQITRFIQINDYEMIVNIEYYNGGYIIGDFNYGSYYDTNFELISKNVFDWGESIADKILNLSADKTGTQNITVHNDIIYRLVSGVNNSKGYADTGIIYKFKPDGKYIGYLTASPARVGQETVSILFDNNRLLMLSDGSFAEIYYASLYGDTDGYHLLLENYDVDDCVASGTYLCTNGTIASTINNLPISGSGFRLEVKQLGRTNRVQILIPNSNIPTVYMRTWLDSTKYGKWYKFTGEEV